MNVLHSYNPTPTRRCKPHDYMDDLESFFYVLCWIVCGYSGPGNKLTVFPRYLLGWESADPQLAIVYKLSATSRDHFKETYSATPYFGPIFGTLMRQLSAFFSAADVKNRDFGDEPSPSLVELQFTSSKDYEIVLGYVNEAIEALELEPPETEHKDILNAARTPVAANFAVPALPPPGQSRPGKRGSGRLDEDVARGSPSKKQRHHYQTRSSFSLSTTLDTSGDNNNDDDE